MIALALLGTRHIVEPTQKQNPQKVGSPADMNGNGRLSLVPVFSRKLRDLHTSVALI